MTVIPFHPGRDRPQADAALEAHIAQLALGARLVLEDLHLRLRPGCWTAIVGPNGAGKSTLLRALAGLQACEGEVRLQGRLLAQWPARERARALAWLGQNEAPTGELRAGDVVMLGRAPHRAWLAPASAADHAAVRQAMEATGCWAWRERRLSALSGGERQRVLLARALAVQAVVLLMDEPLAHLDPPHQADWVELVRALRTQGTAVASVLHELSIALQADELIVLAGGRLLHQGAPGEAATQRALQQAFNHRLDILNLRGRWIALPRGVLPDEGRADGSAQENPR
ncbi:ABC transporter ATP-binding protein [Azohydromonas caseinilytica]|uniref:ABC transporter ATP-binding protein n=1 Tax=Azohydromonas caseinilytica TaxID=2728836 RepID=A0A848F9R6_9BURK|nr:ABC transporter ATP-binding protein [Azohydromonas caseinilytica]NML15998.1 ABC transporter ATP-binding protein [Azohydromonas caseinilytica]